MTERRVTQEIVEADVVADVIQRRVTQEIVEADVIADVIQRRITQAVVEADVVASTIQRRVTQVIVEADVAFKDPPAAIITANPTQVTANGTSTSTITVQGKSTSGVNLITGGDTVVLQTTFSSLGAVVDNGDGTYTATLAASSSDGTATITGTFNGETILDNATVVFVVPVPVEVPPANPSLDTGNYKVIIADLNGVRIEEIPWQNLSYSWRLNAPGSCSFVLPRWHEKCTRSLMKVGAREIHVYRKGVKVWGGYLWTANGSLDEATVRFNGEGYFSRLNRRLLAGVTNTSYPNANFIFDALDTGNNDSIQENIAWTLIDYAQSLTNGNMGFTRGNLAQSTKRRSKTWLSDVRHNIGQEITGLAGASEGFDFEIDANKVWRTYYPKKGTTLSSLFTVGKNIRNINVQEDATSTATEVTGSGAFGNALYLVIKEDATALAEYGRLQSLVSLHQDDTPDEIDRRTVESLRILKKANTLPQISIQVTEDPPFGSFVVGDEMPLNIQSGWINFNETMRINSITVEVSNEGSEVLTVAFENKFEV